MKQTIGIGLLIVLLITVANITQGLPDADQTLLVSWNVQKVSDSIYTDEFDITQSSESVRLDNLKQKTNTIMGKAIVEYRLMRLEEGSFVDTGIYKVFAGSIGKFETNLYGEITPGTYKIKISNLSEDELVINSRRNTND